MKYKGEKVALESLLGTTKMIPAWFENGTLPEIKDKNGYNISYGGKINKLVMVTGVTKYSGYLGINYYNYINFKGEPRTAILPDDFEIFTLTGKQGTKMLEMVTKHEQENFHRKLYTRWLSGSDPEIFAEKNKIVVPAFSFLGSKESPKHKVPQFSDTNTLKLYHDGFAMEFETKAVACLAYHLDSVHQGLKAAYEAIKAKDKKATLTIRNTMMIPSDVMNEASDKDIAFGCMPSLNVYGMQGKNVHPRDLPFRFAGGHIHFGCGKQPKEKIEAGVKALDKILAVACVSLFAKLDTPMRREYYGMAGEYRLPEHGLEYRVLSNAWLCHPLIANFVFDLARKVLNFGMQGYSSLWNATEEETIKTINTCDVQKAQEILLRNKDVFMKLLEAAYGGYDLSIVFDTFLNGVEHIIKDPTDIVKNWYLEGGWTTHCGNKNNSFNSAFPQISKKGKV